MRCIHGRPKNMCKYCGGENICEHKRIRTICRECMDDPIKMTIKNWIRQSKQSDRKKNRLDLSNLIDTNFCKNLVKEYTNCIYCKIELQYRMYNGSLATIERINNDIGHIKSNCVIACRTCNYSKVGDLQTVFGVCKKKMTIQSKMTT